MGAYREPSRPWEIIYLDFVGPFPRSKNGNCYMLVVVDAMSKFVHIHPMRTATTKTTLACLKNHIFLVFGTPKYLIGDNGPQFTAHDFKAFLNEYSVKSWYTSRYHPQANAAEAANKTIETSIRAYIKDSKDHKCWDKYIGEIACAMNTSVHTSTKHTPYFINFGQRMFTTGEDYIGPDIPPIADKRLECLNKIRDNVKVNLKRSYDQNKRRYDLRARSISYQVGDVVWVKGRVLSNAIKGITEKFSPTYRKCTIKRKIGSNSYEVVDFEGKNLGIYNTDCFKT